MWQHHSERGWHRRWRATQYAAGVRSTSNRRELSFLHQGKRLSVQVVGNPNPSTLPTKSSFGAGWRERALREEPACARTPATTNTRLSASDPPHLLVKIGFKPASTASEHCSDGTALDVVLLVGWGAGLSTPCERATRQERFDARRLVAKRTPRAEHTFRQHKTGQHKFGQHKFG
jgi:hypothetical protein